MSINALTQKYDDGEQVFKQATDALSRLFEPMINMTMLSGISSTIESATYSQTNPLFAIAGNIAQNYAGQVVPTLFGQIARTIDDTRRTTYADKDSWVPDSVQTFLQRQANKIPGLSQNQPAYTDVWGRPDRTENWVLRAFENFLSPGYIGNRSASGAENALRELYNATGDSAVLPSKPQKSYKVNGEEHNFTAEQWLKYSNRRGQASFDMLNKIVDTDAYQNMSNQDKKDLVSKVYDYADAMGRMDTIDGYQLEGWIAGAKDAEQNGVPSWAYTLYQTQKSISDAKAETDKSIKKYDYMTDIVSEIMSDDNLNDSQKQKTIQNLVINGISDNQEEKYAAIADKVPAADYARAYYEFQRIEDNNPDLGAGEQNALKRDYLMQNGLSAEQKHLIDENIINDGMYIPKDLDVDYSNPTSFILTQMSDAAQRKFSRFGMSAEDYRKVYPIATAQGKKAQVIANLQAAGMTYSEAARFYRLVKKK